MNTVVGANSSVVELSSHRTRNTSQTSIQYTQQQLKTHFLTRALCSAIANNWPLCIYKYITQRVHFDRICE
jgi:hypothetical protein